MADRRTHSANPTSMGQQRTRNLCERGDDDTLVDVGFAA